MSTGLAVKPMGKKKSPTTPKMGVTKIDEAILRDARIVVAVTNEPLGIYLSRLLKPLIVKDKEVVLKQETAPKPKR